jgi:hypothetical protein
METEGSVVMECRVKHQTPQRVFPVAQRSALMWPQKYEPP